MLLEGQICKRFILLILLFGFKPVKFHIKDKDYKKTV